MCLHVLFFIFQWSRKTYLAFCCFKEIKITESKSNNKKMECNGSYLFTAESLQWQWQMNKLSQASCFFPLVSFGSVVVLFHTLHKGAVVCMIATTATEHSLHKFYRFQWMPLWWTLSIHLAPLVHFALWPIKK